MYGPSDRSIQRPETIIEHLIPYVGPGDMVPHVGPVGPDNVGPTNGPHYGPTGPTSGSHHMWGPYNQLYVGLTIVFQTKKLNSNKINPHSTYIAPRKTL